MGTGLEGLKHGQQAMDEKIGQTEGDAGKAIMAALQKILGASGTGAEKGVGGPASPYAPAIKALSGEEQTPGTPLSGK
jgi:hypothetical protein